MFCNYRDDTATKEVVLSYFCLHLINVASFAKHRPFVIFLIKFSPFGINPFVF